MNLGMKLIRMKLGMKLTFLHVFSHTQIHLFGSDHSYGCVQANLGLPKSILNIKSAIFLHMVGFDRNNQLQRGFPKF